MACDQLIIEFDRAVRALFHGAEYFENSEYCPSDLISNLSPEEERLSSSLMRVNHTGEVCAQALYSGQLLMARRAEVKKFLTEVVDEENAHLRATGKRLIELKSKPSKFDPIFYCGSFVLGAFAGVFGDRWSLGFVAETEKQVEEHLNSHLEKLPNHDRRSKAVLEKMREDEIRHGSEASNQGGSQLPDTVVSIMGLTASLMKKIAYRI